MKCYHYCTIYSFKVFINCSKTRRVQSQTQWQQIVCVIVSRVWFLFPQILKPEVHRLCCSEVIKVLSRQNKSQTVRVWLYIQLHNLHWKFHFHLCLSFVGNSYFYFSCRVRTSCTPAPYSHTSTLLLHYYWHTLMHAHTLWPNPVNTMNHYIHHQPVPRQLVSTR